MRGLGGAATALFPVASMQRRRTALSRLGTHRLEVLPLGRLDLDLVEEVGRLGCALEGGVDLAGGGLEDEGPPGIETVVDPETAPFVGLVDEILSETGGGGILALDFEA